MSRVGRITSALISPLLVACASIAHGTRPDDTRRSAITVVERTSEPWTDTAGTLSIVVRDVDEPNHPLPEAVVVVAPAGANLEATTIPRVLADRDGEATFGRLSDGQYDVLVRRVGYKRFQFTVALRARCSAALEIYLGRAPNCLFECPVTPARAVLTTCRRPA